MTHLSVLVKISIMYEKYASDDKVMPRLKIANPQSVDHVAKKPQPEILTFLDLEIDLTPLHLERDNLAKAYQTLFELPEFEQLIKESTFHPIKVKFLPKEKMFANGECDSINKQINLNESASFHDKFTLIIFELCNAANKRLQDNSWYKYHADENAYALSMEKSEYLSTLKYKDILIKLADNKKIMTVLEKLSISISYLVMLVLSMPANFDECWKSVNEVPKDKTYSDKGYSHADYYRRGYREWKNFQRESKINDSIIDAIVILLGVVLSLNASTNFVFGLAISMVVVGCTHIIWQNFKPNYVSTVSTDGPHENKSAEQSQQELTKNAKPFLNQFKNAKKANSIPKASVTNTVAESKERHKVGWAH